jgi:uncharacterized protein (TIGR00255 family)
MLRSMTGYGSARGQDGGVAYDVEIRAVNHRYLKAIVRLPDVWSSAEAEIEKRLRKQVRRGSVTVSVRMKVTDDQAAYQVNSAVLNRYVDQLRQLEVDANPTMRIDLAALLQLPGVCESPSYENICEQTRETLMSVVDEAVVDLVDMRSREGEALASDLLANCEAVEKSLAIVSERAETVVTDYHARLQERVAQLLEAAKLELDADSLAREVAVYAERSDVAEEISRLTGHIEQFRLNAASGEAAGRKLDFIAQEMLREANTIGSKASDTEISRAVVEMKTAVDRIKEQVQNVE